MRFICLLLLLLPLSTFSQQCGTDEVHESLLRTSPVYRNLVNQALMYKPCIGNCDTGSNDTIPVVVHIVHTGEPIGSLSNPGDAAIEQMIQNLNTHFAAGYPGINQTFSVNTNIVFQLAKRTADCQATNGINRVNASGNATYVQYGIGAFYGYPGISQVELANMAYWDNTRYFNIWIVNKIEEGAIGGYGYFPTGAYSLSDGILVQNTFVLTLSDMIAHETGHYLNLLHTFTGWSPGTCPVNTSCQYLGDKVCDTDPIMKNPPGCNPNDFNPCAGKLYGNSVYNFMSYCNHTMFTEGQKQRMRETLYNLRYPLIRSNGHLPPPCNSLPVTMGTVQVTGQCGNADIRWQTFQETGNKGFEVQHSRDGITFSAIGFVTGKQHSMQPVSYSFKTKQLNSGTSFFRLKQVDNDGRTSLTGIVAYTNKCNGPLRVYPNPASGSLYVEGNSNTTLTIINTMGVVVKRVTLSNTATINISELPPGVYFIGDESNKTRFVKSK